MTNLTVEQAIPEMRAEIASLSDADLERELGFASEPGNDEYAVAWLQCLKDEEASRAKSA